MPCGPPGERARLPPVAQPATLAVTAMAQISVLAVRPATLHIFAYSCPKVQLNDGSPWLALGWSQVGCSLGLRRTDEQTPSSPGTKEPKRLRQPRNNAWINP
jgi:hypothetical protein